MWDFTSSPRLIVIRFFNVNKPGAEVDELKGGVAGGSILTGVLTLGMRVEIRPGIIKATPTAAFSASQFSQELCHSSREQNQLQLPFRVDWYDD